MRALRVLFAAVVAALSLVVVGATPSFACSCAMADTATHVKWADVVVSGTVTDLVSLSSHQATGYVVAVDHVFKGEVGSTVEVLSESSGASCGLENVKAGRRYVFFAGYQKAMGEQRLAANLCGGTGPATPKLVSAVEVATETGEAPPEADAQGTAYQSDLVVTFDDQGPAGDDVLADWALPIGLAAGASLVLLTGVLWIRHALS